VDGNRASIRRSGNFEGEKNSTLLSLRNRRGKKSLDSKTATAKAICIIYARGRLGKTRWNEHFGHTEKNKGGGKGVQGWIRPKNERRCSRFFWALTPRNISEGHAKKWGGGILLIGENSKGEKKCFLGWRGAGCKKKKAGEAAKPIFKLKHGD